ncbi:MAG: Fic family protein [Euryarchaeota archaeon]|nr:Fic family protein [Euryarchaeota archaeon]
MANTDIIRKELLERIEEKKKRLDSMRPLPKDALRRLHEELRLLHTHHSNAIEGNTLTLSETKLVVEEGITIGGKPLKDCLEARNTANAYDLIEGLARGRKITHEALQKIHEALTRGILEDAGRYRTKNVRITGAIKTPPNFSKVAGLMDRLLNRVNESKGNAVETSAFLHHNFVEIHPFSDGNGRVARLLNNLHLIRHGYPPIVLRREDRAKYYKSLRSADAGNLAPFANFIARAVDESLMQHLSIFGGKDELLPLKEVARNSPYSQEYLSLRARQGKLAAVKINDMWHTSRRALEEYTLNISSQR